MFPGMVRPAGVAGQARDEGVQKYIDKYSAMPDVLAWKMPGAGGGGYLACVVTDADTFAKDHTEAIRLTIRRAGM